MRRLFPVNDLEGDGDKEAESGADCSFSTTDSDTSCVIFRWYFRTPRVYSDLAYITNNISVQS